MKLQWTARDFVWEITTASTMTLPVEAPPLTRWQQIIEYLKVLYR